MARRVSSSSVAALAVWFPLSASLAFGALVAWRWFAVVLLSLFALGAPYLYGAGHPAGSVGFRGPFDCSGFVLWVASWAVPLRWRRLGDYSATDLWEACGRPSWGLHLPGSLIWWEHGDGTVQHVGFVVVPFFLAVSAFGSVGGASWERVKFHPYSAVGRPVLATAWW